MIAKAATISHGSNAIRYSVNKDRSDIVKTNLLPDDISPEAMFKRMMFVQKMFANERKRGRPLTDNVIRIEISPTAEESKGWTMDDWARLADEFIQEFDSIDLSKKTKRASSKQTNLKGSQYVVDANRVDMEGKINDGHLPGMRAVMAANIINERYGWMQAEEIGIRHKQEVSGCCMEILRKMDKFSWERYEAELVKRGYGVHIQKNEDGTVYGYSIKRGNSSYKSSKLGVGRNLVPSKIMNTWQKLHPQEGKIYQSQAENRQTRTATPTAISKPQATPQPVMKHYSIGTDNNRTFNVSLSDAADNIIRQECSLKEAHPLAKLEEIQHTALLLFAGYLDAATSMAASSGGGGSDTGGWGRDKDEDELEWARRCARMANQMCKRRKGLHR